MPTIHPAVHCRTHNSLYCDTVPVGTHLGLPGVDPVVAGTRGAGFPMSLDPTSGLAAHLATHTTPCIVDSIFIVKPGGP